RVRPDAPSRQEFREVPPLRHLPHLVVEPHARGARPRPALRDLRMPGGRAAEGVRPGSRPRADGPPLARQRRAGGVPLHRSRADPLLPRVARSRRQLRGAARARVSARPPWPRAERPRRPIPHERLIAPRGRVVLLVLVSRCRSLDAGFRRPPAPRPATAQIPLPAWAVEEGGSGASPRTPLPRPAR